MELKLKSFHQASAAFEECWETVEARLSVYYDVLYGVHTSPHAQTFSRMCESHTYMSALGCDSIDGGNCLMLSGILLEGRLKMRYALVSQLTDVQLWSISFHSH